MNRRIVPVMLVLAGAILWLSHESFLFYRDNFSTHYPLKSLTAELTADGLPLWNPYVGGGQPFAGNPNLLTFYPTTLLFFALPAHVAFNLHFFLHLGIAWFGFRRLLTDHDTPGNLAAAGATLYVLSGAVVSCLVFFNLIIHAALLPWVIGEVRRLIRHPVTPTALRLGALGGLVGLAPEPTTIVGTLVLLGWLTAISRPGRRALVNILLASLLSLAIAAPQILAFAEIAGETERSAYGYSTESATAASLGPLRVAEMILGPVFGSALDHGPGGYWANRPEGHRWPPFFLSVMLSSLAIPALMAGRRFERVAYLVPLLILLFLSLGRFNPLVSTLYDHMEPLRILRYPEKFALLVTFLATLMIGLMLRDLISESSPARAWSRWSMLLVALTLSLVLATTSLERSATVSLIGTSLLQALPLAILGFGRWKQTARIAMLAALVPLAVWSGRLIPLDRALFYAHPSPLASTVPDGPLSVPPISPAWDELEPRELYRMYAFRMNPVFGARFGTRYVLDRSPEGMYSYLSRLSAERAASVDDETESHYLRIAGASATLRSEPFRATGTHLRHQWELGGYPALLYEIEDARPFLWQPRRLLHAANASEAVAMIEDPGYEPLRDSVAPSWVAASLPADSGRIRLLEKTSQQMRFEVISSSGTVVVVNQTWFSAWTARSGVTALETFPADIDRLGLVVPPGTHVVDLQFGRRRSLIALSLALAVALLLYVVFATSRSSSRTAVPAR